MMKRILAATALALAAAFPADAQTLPQPAAPNNTIMCMTVNSTLSVNGQAIGQAHACFGLPDATAQALIAAYGENCPPTVTTTTVPGGGPGMPSQQQTTTTPCTVPQIVQYLGQGLFQGVLGNVMRYLTGQASSAAAAAVQAPTVNPVQ
jgi:hypothetical protein